MDTISSTARSPGRSPRACAAVGMIAFAKEREARS